MSCSYQNLGSLAQVQSIQLLVAGYLLEKDKSARLTGHVLEVLRRNAVAFGVELPHAIQITAVQILDGRGVRRGIGEEMVMISYKTIGPSMEDGDQWKMFTVFAVVATMASCLLCLAAYRYGWF